MSQPLNEGGASAQHNEATPQGHAGPGGSTIREGMQSLIELLTTIRRGPTILCCLYRWITSLSSGMHCCTLLLLTVEGFSTRVALTPTEGKTFMSFKK